MEYEDFDLEKMETEEAMEKNAIKLTEEELDVLFRTLSKLNKHQVKFIPPAWMRNELEDFLQSENGEHSQQTSL